jgi:hypothetical protein
MAEAGVDRIVGKRAMPAPIK